MTTEYLDPKFRTDCLFWAADRGHFPEILYPEHREEENRLIRTASVEAALGSLAQAGIGPVSATALENRSMSSQSFRIRTQAQRDLCCRAQLPVAVRTLYDYTPSELLARQMVARVGVSTPKVHATHEDLDRTPSFTFTLEDWGGEPWVATALAHKTEREKMITYIAGQLAAIHSVTPKTGYGFLDTEAARQGVLLGVHSSYRNSLMSSLRPSLQVLSKATILMQEDVDRLHTFYATTPLIDELERLPTALLHGDPGYHNALVDADGHPTYLIDFGESKAGPGLYDLAVCRRPLSFLPGEAKESWLQLVKAYENEGGMLPDKADQYLALLKARINLCHLSSGVRFARRKPGNNTIVKKQQETALAELQEDLDMLGVGIR